MSTSPTRRRRTAVTEPPPARTIVQITTVVLSDEDGRQVLVRTALCVDGTVWELAGRAGTWRALPAIPTGDPADPATSGRRPDGSGIDRRCHYCQDPDQKRADSTVGCLVCFGTGMISADESDAEAAERAHCIPCDGHGFIGTDKTPCAPCDGTGFRFPSKRAPDRAACIPPVARR